MTMQEAVTQLNTAFDPVGVKYILTGPTEVGPVDSRTFKIVVTGPSSSQSWSDTMIDQNLDDLVGRALAVTECRCRQHEIIPESRKLKL